LGSKLNARREIVVDFKERRKMCEHVIRLKGLMPAKKHEDRVGRTLEEILMESHQEN